MVPLTHSWKKKVFEEDPALRPEARVKRQVDGIVEALGLKHRARVLDLGCGAGSQTLELARRMYRVVGLDEAQASFSAAREKAKAESLTVHFVAGDMRRIPYEGEFDAAVNLRNPIGAYASERDDLRCLESVHGALKRGGKIVLDLLNREWLIRRLGVAGKGEAGSETFDLAASRLDGRSYQSRGGAKVAAVRMRIYSLTELIRILEETGFAFRSVYGGPDLRPYSVETLRMIVVGEKVAMPPKRRRPEDDLPQALRIKGRPR